MFGSGGTQGDPSDEVDEEAILCVITKDVETRKKVEELDPAQLTAFVEGLETAHLEKEARAAADVASASGASVAAVTVPAKMYTYVMNCKHVRAFVG